MAGYLPRGWLGKQVAVLFNADGSAVGRLHNDSDGGVMLDMVQDQSHRKLFIPWASVRYVELLEEADERTYIEDPYASD